MNAHIRDFFPHPRQTTLECRVESDPPPREAVGCRGAEQDRAVEVGAGGEEEEEEEAGGEGAAGGVVGGVGG